MEEEEEEEETKVYGFLCISNKHMTFSYNFKDLSLRWGSSGLGDTRDFTYVYSCTVKL